MSAEDKDRMERTSRAAAGRRIASLAVVAAAGALLLGACGSGASTTGTTTTAPAGPTTSTTPPTDPAAQLAALEAVPSGNVSVQETGSSLLYPVFSTWSDAYHTAWPNVSITGAATGSGTGVSDALAGTVDIGGSDAYLPPADFSSHPDVENIPLAISAQQVNYNVPGIPATTHLDLNGTILAGMYTGKITNWDDPAIASANPGVKLPNLAVHPLHRSDSSGDTFLFTSYLTDSAASAWTLGFDTSVTWPNVANSAGDAKNSGMVSGCSATPGCVAYIGISYLSKTESAGLGEAALQDKAGSYELPTPAAILADAAAFTNVPANGAISLIDGPGAGAYPIVNFEYAIVLTTQSSSTKGQAIKSLLAWIMDPTKGSTSTYLSPVNFQPLPAGALAVAIKLLQKISPAS